MKKAFILLFLIGFLLYLPSLFGPFLWDDEDFVYANKYVANFQIDKFFTDSQTAGRGKVSNYFRPVPQIIYASVHTVTGFHPFWYHLVNVLTHVGAAWAIYYFSTILIEKNLAMTNFARTAGPQRLRWESSTQNFVEARLIAFLVALFFLIHPVQTEAVSYISGLSDPLFVLFGFLSLIFFPQKKSWLFFALSLLSKETGIVFLGLMFLLNFRKTIPYCLLTIAYLWYHLTYINALNMATVWGDNLYAHSVTVRLLTFIQNLWTYFGLLIFPKDLFMERDYSTVIQTTLSANFFIFITFIAFIVFILIKKKSPILWFCFLGFFISFLPYSGIVLINGLFYEHFLYLPLVFFFAFWIILFFSLFGPRIIVIIFITVILLGLRNISRQFDWSDAIRFYSQTLSHAPQSIRIQNGLAMAYADAGRNNEAIEQYNNAIKLNPNVPNLYHNLANAYLATGNTNLTETNYLKAIAVDPKFIFSWQSLAALYQQTGQTEKLQKLIEEFQSRSRESDPGPSHYQ